MNGFSAGERLTGIIGIGIDLVEITRFESSLKKGERFTARVFTPTEMESLMERHNLSQALAARFAVKEAVLKSLGLGFDEVSPLDVEVVSLSSGQPTVALSQRLQERFKGRPITVVVSLSHTDQYAVAQAMALELKGA